MRNGRILAYEKSEVLMQDRTLTEVYFGTATPRKPAGGEDPAGAIAFAPIQSPDQGRCHMTVATFPGSMAACIGRPERSISQEGSNLLLDIEHLNAGYRKIQILFDISLRVAAGEIVGLIGHNGAGKTTLLKTVMGLVKATGGTIGFDGEDLTNAPSMVKLDRGIFHVPQENYVFKALSVKDNLALSFFRINDKELFAERLEEVCQYFPILKERLGQQSSTLSGGQRRMLGIAMGLLRHPRLLLLDEPSVGLSPRIFQDVLEVVWNINQVMNTTIMLVEQNVKAAFELSDRVYVLKSGQVVFEELLKRDEWWDLF